VFAILGFTDVALGWYPLGLGNPEWEFGTISGSLNAMAIPILGLYLALASAIARSDRMAARIIAVIMGVLLAIVISLGVIYLTDIPMAFKAVQSSTFVTLGIKKAIAKALLLGVGDSTLLALGMVTGWRVPSKS
jgi:4-amino-4-deoxy-L-arabinose transferase-like glycosyltransferase